MGKQVRFTRYPKHASSLFFFRIFLTLIMLSVQASPWSRRHKTKVAEKSKMNDLALLRNRALSISNFDVDAARDKRNVISELGEKLLANHADPLPEPISIEKATEIYERAKPLCEKLIAKLQAEEYRLNAWQLSQSKTIQGAIQGLVDAGPEEWAILLG